MANYSTKPEPVDAWQYTAMSTALPMWVGPYIRVEPRTQGYKLMAVGSVGDRRDTRSYHGEDGCREVEPGNWIVKDSHGVWLYDARVFKTKFEALPEESKK